MGLFFGHNQMSSVDNDFVFTIDTTKGTGASFTLPLRSGFTYDFVVDWGDNSSSEITAYNDADITHAYAAGGVYQLTITGTCQAWYFNNTGDKLKFTRVDSWGNVGFDGIGLTSAFRGCSNLVYIPNEQFPYTYLTSMLGTFLNCTGLTGTKIPSNFLYGMSNLTNLQQCFQGINMELYDDFLRYCPKLTNVSYLHYAVNLTDKNIPNNYFYYNKLVKDYSYTFGSTRNMVIPSSLFDLSVLNIVTAFDYFMGVSSTAYSPTGIIQDIWNYALSATSVLAFRNATAITNYADIPAGWT